MAYPIAVLVTQDSTPSQREFAAAAACVVADVERVGALVADEGLKLMGVTELDLEVAVHKLGQHFDGVRCGNPEVIYEEGPPRLEPYYRATVESPEDCWSELMADMADRRGLITAITDVASGKQFVAEVPVSECFGYSTKVWWLSKGRGKYSLEFSHYGKLGGFGVP